MPALADFCPHKPRLICFDSDGSVMDTMNTKHQNCFGPCLVEAWGLQAQAAQVLRRWDEINLFSHTRGVNRYTALGMILQELAQNGTPIDGLDVYLQWLQTTRETSDKAVQQGICQAQAAGRNAGCLQRALAWSRQVNARVEALPLAAKTCFAAARAAVPAAAAVADLAVVSSANPEALHDEWAREGLLPHIGVLLSQKDGTKADCLAALRACGYAPDHILMVGDAAGDVQAAQQNGVWFYPILAGQEDRSWREFCREALPRFAAGRFDTACQRRLLDRFAANLSGGR